MPNSRCSQLPLARFPPRVGGGAALVKNPVEDVADAHAV